MNSPAPYRFRSIRRGAVAIAVAVAAGTLAPPAVAASGTGAGTGTGTAKTDVVQQRLNALVADDALPGALAAVRGRDGHTRNYTAGVGDLATSAKVPVDGQIRIGSNTKSFVAVVVLQLVAEGKVDLDASVDTYLPGLVHGDGIDGRNITVRQILQHTSGLPDYTEFLEISSPAQYVEPRELLDAALAHKPDFAPGTGWKYSNTGYVVAGLIVQKVTGRPVGEEITKRVIDRIGLRHTYFPAQGDMTIRERHPHGYLTEKPGDPPQDVTEMDPSWAWAAGAMVSTNTDLNRFFSALIGGELLPPAQLAQMRTTVPAGHAGPGARYGLGIESHPLPCGGLSWGHGGSVPGYVTRGGVTEDGRAVNIAVTMLPSLEVKQHVADAADAALCR
ncbi:serine hydrolase [Streptomyces sp. FH025]|uniref:serine hydrolase domain-containing protein n=1 Tax=Streptomyces sp. FH025 TaxID=2815937 RepID=UPI001A9F6FC4|nr:serine hydrolase domain-containing protein [Streptomyces sp. FH025]MBO1416240.1 beta-lactamase family protein [Streptomyces sp. FH025]